ncbi:MAG: hypothetical protein WAP05_00860 [Dethiobacteria bacterium]|nr:hypothetical protein [Bacillota bacterium]
MMVLAMVFVFAVGCAPAEEIEDEDAEGFEDVEDEEGADDFEDIDEEEDVGADEEDEE